MVSVASLEKGRLTHSLHDHRMKGASQGSVTVNIVPCESLVSTSIIPFGRLAIDWQIDYPVRRSTTPCSTFVHSRSQMTQSFKLKIRNSGIEFFLLRIEKPPSREEGEVHSSRSAREKVRVSVARTRVKDVPDVAFVMFLKGFFQVNVLNTESDDSTCLEQPYL